MDFDTVIDLHNLEALIFHATAYAYHGDMEHTIAVLTLRKTQLLSIAKL